MRKLGALIALVIVSITYCLMIVSIDVATKDLPEIEYTILFLLFHFGVMAALFCFGIGLMKGKIDWADDDGQ